MACGAGDRHQPGIDLAVALLNVGAARMEVAAAGAVDQARWAAGIGSSASPRAVSIRGIDFSRPQV